jgi:hypothetical protein
MGFCCGVTIKISSCAHFFSHNMAFSFGLSVLLVCYACSDMNVSAGSLDTYSHLVVQYSSLSVDGVVAGYLLRDWDNMFLGNSGNFCGCGLWVFPTGYEPTPYGLTNRGFTN